MQRRMLTKEDEAASGGDEVEVRREDQDKINKFSRLHQREMALEEELKSKHARLPYPAQLPSPTDRIQNRGLLHLVAAPRGPGPARDLDESDREGRVGAGSETRGDAGGDGAAEGRAFGGICLWLVEGIVVGYLLFADRFVFVAHGIGSEKRTESAEITFLVRLVATFCEDVHEQRRKRWPAIPSSVAGYPGLQLLTRPDPHNAISRVVSGIDEADARERYALEKADNGFSPPGSASSTIVVPGERERYDLKEEDNSFFPPPSASSTIVVSAERKIVSWKDGDAENPYNWSTSKKVSIVIIGTIVVINSTMGSSLPSNAIPIISKEFNVTSSYVKTLPISMYLLGYVLGPLLFGPLSESYGRRVIMLSTFFGFTVFTMACALAPNYASLLIFRLLTGINASSPIAVVGGVYADIYNDPVTRGRAMAGTCIGPLIAPVISGFVAPTSLGWRWVFWIGLIAAGVSWIPTFFLPETYGPILLARRAAALRKSTRDPSIFAPIELETKGWKQMATVTLTRPLRMLFFELLVLATCLYVSLAYAIFYMYFQAYPIVFQGIYGQSLGVSGLMFLPIGGGAMLALVVFLWWDAYLRRAQLAKEPWTRREESRRLPLAFLGGPLYVVALFWLGWTSRPSIPFYVPMLAGLPFGMGFVLIFMALLNYLADAYEIFAASAMAAASCARSVAGAVLPFAAAPMYRRLGVPWASSLLAFASLGMCAIPWVFLWKGDRIREGSQFCRLLKERKEVETMRLRAERERGAVGMGGDKV
ncbi:major facilitator superfamily transporter [Diplocarpon rosae]|nr:major facilitator superfamily transporter [Diplocarpon rosae]